MTAPTSLRPAPPSTEFEARTQACELIGHQPVIQPLPEGGVHVLCQRCGARSAACRCLGCTRGTAA